jgi:hypothetical protein
VTLSLVPSVPQQLGADPDLEQEPVRSYLQEQALELLRQGLTTRAIARAQGVSPSTAFRRAQAARKREERETPEEVRADLSMQLDDVIGRMRLILVSENSKIGEKTRAAEQIISAAKAKARLVGAEAPSRQIIKLNYVSEEALAEEQQQLEATLTAMGVDLSVLPTAEEIAQKLLASRPALNAGPAT